MKKRIWMRILSVFFALLLSGCNPGAGSEHPTDGGTENGGITLAMHAPKSLHPLKTNQNANVLIYDLIYDSLVYVDREMRPVPYLAENCTVSPDKKTIFFTLRSDILWHDGAAFTASDVEHTINTIRQIGEDGIYFNKLAYVESVEVVDMLHFNLILREPHITVLNNMDFPIIPCHRTDLDTTLVGTGQYKLETYSPQKSIVLKRNMDFRLSPVPETEYITVKILEPSTSEANMVKIGEVTAVTASLDGIGGLGIGGNTTITKYPTLSYEYIGFNFRNPHLASYRVRYAISYAIDRARMIDDAYLGYGRATCVPVPPTSYLYIGAETDKIQYDPEKAKALLYEDGYVEENGVMTKTSEEGESMPLRLTILRNEENAYRKKYVNAAVETLSAIGIAVEVISLPFADYKTRLSEGNFDLYAAGCRFSQDLSYDFLLGSGKTAQDGYVSQDMDLARDGLRYPAQDAELTTAYKYFAEIFLRDMPFAGIAFLDGALVHSTDLQGVENLASSKIYRNIGQWKLQKKG